MDKKDIIVDPFNYIGSKKKLLSQIIPLLPEKITTHIELFSGGYALGLNLGRAENYIYNDKCWQVASLVRMFKNNDPYYIIGRIDELIDKYKLPLTTKNNTEEHQQGFMLLRSDYNNIKGNTLDKNIYLYTLMCHSFNNMFGFNSSLNYNIPFGKNRSTFNSSLRDKVINFSNRIKEIDLKVYSQDFNNIVRIDSKSKGTILAYVDPPYYISDSAYCRNAKTPWGEQEELSLYRYLDELHEVGFKFALSNVVESKKGINQILKYWMSKYNVHLLDHSYSNCNYQRTDRDIKDVEVLVTNY